MKPEKARKQLEKILLSFNAGSVFLMIGEVYGEWAEYAKAHGSEMGHDNYKLAEATVTVVGFGLDAILPKPRMK